jgi:hypothetical protein
MVTRAKIEEIVRASLLELDQRDRCLLQIDVSERAITHKLAEYLQQRIPELNVDCEYNRNVEYGPYAQKKIIVLKERRKDLISGPISEDDLLAISTYPDIIVHRRMKNDENVLVIEVKKRNSQIDHWYDHQKLQAFTEKTGRNSYHYQYGVFILLDTGHTEIQEPELTWFINGQQETSRTGGKFSREQSS